MAARQTVELIISARDRSRAVFRRIRRGLSGLQAQLVGLAGLLGAGAFARQFFAGARDIDNAATALGVSAERLQAVQLLAAGQGANIRDTVDALLQLQQAAVDARNDGGELLAIFQRLGFGEIPSDAVELFVQLGQAVQNSRSDVAQLNADVSRLLGEEATRQFLGLFRERGGQIQQLIEVRANSNLVRAGSEVRQSAEIARDAQVELTVAINQLNATFERQLPDLIRALTAALEAFERRESPEGIIPGGVGATVRGTIAGIPDVLADAARAAPENIAGAVRIALSELIDSSAETARNTREGERLQ